MFTRYRFFASSMAQNGYLQPTRNANPVRVARDGPYPAFALNPPALYPESARTPYCSAPRHHAPVNAVDLATDRLLYVRLSVTGSSSTHPIPYRDYTDDIPLWTPSSWSMTHPVC